MDGRRHGPRLHVAAPQPERPRPAARRAPLRRGAMAAPLRPGMGQPEAPALPVVLSRTTVSSEANSFRVAAPPTALPVAPLPFGRGQLVLEFWNELLVRSKSLVRLRYASEG